LEVIALWFVGSYISVQNNSNLKVDDMNADTRKLIWGQFGAAIDTLENAIQACPDNLWFDQSGYHQIWYMVYHTLFWLDYYLNEDHEDFKPPEPFGLEELDPSGIIPERPYTKNELLAYLEYGRDKCRETIKNMTEESAGRTYKFGQADLTYADLLLYNMRHVQHHAAQINLLLRQKTDSAPGWVFQSKSDLDGTIQ
jgi:hypothetical protein